MTTRDWTWPLRPGAELRLMRLPDRKALYLVLNDEDGMRCLARALGDREATELAEWLDDIVNQREPYTGSRDGGTS